MYFMKNVFKQFIVFLIVCALFLSLYFFKENIQLISSIIVNTLGFIGILIVSFFLDIIFFQPISPSIFLITSIISEELHWFLVFLCVSIGSFLGSLVDYSLGKTLGHSVLTKISSEKRFNEIEKLFQKYSHYAIIIGTFSPIPYSLICWFSGIFEVKFKKFVIFALLSRTSVFLILSLLTKFGLIGTIF